MSNYGHAARIGKCFYVCKFCLYLLRKNEISGDFIFDIMRYITAIISSNVSGRDPWVVLGTYKNIFGVFNIINNFVWLCQKMYIAFTV
ncbi:hypothetical protein GCM10009092_17580 [Bowmanella denitrificans]|uniref:Uncharacterized protein n=1 Tax=Bowmanella denitrificans TaxID=366582 RepID=A0ABN0X2V6_9ALTE